MARRVSFGASMLVAMLCMAACGGSDAGGSDGGAGSSTTASGGAGSVTGTPGSSNGGSGNTGSGNTGSGNTGPGNTGPGNTGPGNTGSGNGGDSGFSYTPWGPDDPPIPGQYAALAASPTKGPRCEAVAEDAPGGAFWATVVAVCHAIRDDAPWPATTTVPAPPVPENAYQACLNAELTAMLQRALRWHADNPGRRPQVAYPSDSSRSPCQSRIYEVRVLTEADAVSPGENQAGKIPVAITAAGIDGDFAVTVDGQPAEVTGDFTVPDPGDGLDTVVVLASPAQQPRTARIEVSTSHGTLVASVQLPGADGSPSPVTENPTPTGPSSSTPEPAPSAGETGP